MSARPQLQRIHLPASVVRHLHVDAPLESPWVWRGLLGVTVLVMAAFVVRAHRRRRRGVVATHRWLRRSAAGGTALVLALLTGLAYVNTYVGYLPTPSSLSAVVDNGQAVPGAVSEQTAARVGPDTSQVVEVHVGAARLHVPDLAAYVYLPPGYTAAANAHRRYPVAYLLHGYPGRPADWMVAGGLPQTMNELIGARQVGPMIVVAPNADGGYLHDSECLNQVGGPQIADYLTGPVVHYVDSHFRTVADRSGRAVAGISSGGYCALNLGLRHLSEYSTIMGFEPYGDPGTSLIRPVLGGSDALFRQNSPSLYLPRLRFSAPVATFVDAGGASPGDVRRVRALALELAHRHQVVAFRVEPGQHHTWKEALAGLPYALVFAAHHLTGGTAPVHRCGHHPIGNVGGPDRSQTDAFAREPRGK